MSPKISLSRYLVEQQRDKGHIPAELRLLLDLRKTEHFALGAFLTPRGLLTSLKSIGPVSRYAVVGAPQLAAAAVESFGTILPLESRAFAAADYAEAHQWVTGARDR